MATPEVYLMQCDECCVYLRGGLPSSVVATYHIESADFSRTREDARKYASRKGWYIGDEELCPKCAAKRGKHGNT